MGSYNDIYARNNLCSEEPMDQKPKAEQDEVVQFCVSFVPDSTLMHLDALLPPKLVAGAIKYCTSQMEADAVSQPGSEKGLRLVRPEDSERYS